VINQQAPSAPERQSRTLHVNSIFDTLQGEGPFAGMRAIFLRLSGCNLQCPMCDTEYTASEEWVVEDLVDFIFDRWKSQYQTFPRHVEAVLVITGGEPFRQALALYRFLFMLNVKASGLLQVQIETNGTYKLEQRLLDVIVEQDVVVVCSPKAHVWKGLWDVCRDVKYVASARDMNPVDGLPVHPLDHSLGKRVAHPPPGWPGTFWLQPEDSKDPAVNAANMGAVRDSCMRHGYRLCLQLHKIVDLP
jgi:7-carboxy-7-deazaguanine synthase